MFALGRITFYTLNNMYFPNGRGRVYERERENII